MEENKKVVYKLERHLWPDEIKVKKMKRQKKTLTIIGIVGIFLTGVILGSTILGGNITSSGSSRFDKLQAVYDILNTRWYFGKEYDHLSQSLIDDAIYGMVENPYDPHTSYLDVETAMSFTSSLSGSFVGIGVQFYDYDGSFIIEKVFKNSPAEASGVEPGDIIIEVDGESVIGYTSKELADVVKGEAGTIVNVVFLRGSERVEKEITRNKVLNSVYGYISNDIGIIEMDSFAASSAQEIEVYFKEFKAQNITKLMIDLRDNGGGYLETTLDIAGMLMGENEVVLQQEDRSGKITPYYSSRKNIYEFDDIVILVNENTASASEVLTAALKETMDITVIGVQTYGKGTVQTSLPFSDGSMLKYTIAQWLTPNGVEINNKGITPDILVSLDPALYTSFVESFEGVFKVDSVGEPVVLLQKYLNFLGFTVDRFDGYFSEVTKVAYHQYLVSVNETVKDELSYDDLRAVFSRVSRYWHENKTTLDLQKVRALEVLNGK